MNPPKRIEQEIKILIAEIYGEQSERLGDLSEWNPRHLITFDCILAFWAIDGLLRLIGMVNESEDPNPDLTVIQNEALNFLVHLRQKDIGKIYLQTGDERSVIIFITICLDRFATLQEIQKRIKTKEIGQRFLEWKSKQTPESFDSLTNIILGRSSRFYNNKGLRKRAGRLAYTPIKEMQIAPYHEGAIEIKAKAFESVVLCYQNLQEAIESGDLGDIPHSIINGVCPVHPKWNKETPLILKEMIDITVKEYFPVLNGDLENSWFGFVNERRKEERQDFYEMGHKRSTLGFREEAGINRDGSIAYAGGEVYSHEYETEQSILDVSVWLKEIEADEALTKVDTLINPNTKNRTKILRVLERALSEDLSIPEICEQEKLDKSIFYKILKKAGETPNSRNHDIRWVYLSDLNAGRLFYRKKKSRLAPKPSALDASNITLIKQHDNRYKWNWLFIEKFSPLTVNCSPHIYHNVYPRYQGVWRGNDCIFWDLKQELYIREYCNREHKK